MTKPRDIIAQAWAMTKREHTIRKWGFVAALLGTLLNTKLFIYQAWLVYSYFQGDPIGFLTMEKVLFESFPFWFFVVLMIFFGVLLIIEWLFPHLAKGAIIGLAAKSHKKEEVKGGLVLAIYNFFPLFALHELLMLSSATMTITLCSLALRYGGGAGPIMVVILATAWLVSNILEFFWIFAEEAVVIRKHGMRDAIRTSFKLVISYLGHVVFLILLMFIIILRIFANLLMVILVPAIVLGIGFLLGSFLPPVISYTVSTIIGLLLIVVASYLCSYLEIFRQTVWTITYIELSKLKELDVIEANK